MPAFGARGERVGRMPMHVLLHLRYTAREAGNLAAPAAAHVKEVLQAPDALFQLFSLNSDFGNAWFMFRNAATDATRRIDIAVNSDQFPYWVKRLGMDDTIRARFAVIDWSKDKLTLAPTPVDFAGDAAGGWTLSIDQASPVFAFVKTNQARKVYMAVSYAAPA
ncbi:hypothetical protein [Massilia sp. CCM 8734]|uniref:hypothetical protein n=1 Tax=Massilia sp. CCM 8734 TaxID=2609283 RepID=UPI00142128D6|nr:hypothetical protein [Massilia sp. CCM 8734]NHZ94215.1 hypothetical protein [Massilia sp. CCM 8734]